MVVALLEELDAKERRLRRVQHLLEQLLRWRYGQKRERVDENQLFLFAAALVSAGKDQTTPPVEQETPPAPPAPSTAPAPTRKGHGRQRLPESLPRRRVVFDLGEHQRQCPHCQGELKHIGEEISERLEYVPASFYVIEEACQKYACSKGCTVVTADKPMQPIDKGLPGPGLLAQVAVSKYGDHLPLHRQQQIYQLVSKAVQANDTPVPVLDPALPRTRTGRIWTYVGNHPYTVYDYTPDRSREGPDAFLREFHGFLQADAHSGYDQLYADPQRAIVEVACWALRQTRSRPILDDIRAYLEAERPKVLPKSPEGQAMAYALSNWAALVRYCQDGDLEIDNHGAERSLRGVAVGRNYVQRRIMRSRLRRSCAIVNVGGQSGQAV